MYLKKQKPKKKEAAAYVICLKSHRKWQNQEHGFKICILSTMLYHLLKQLPRSQKVTNERDPFWMISAADTQQGGWLLWKERIPAHTRMFTPTPSWATQMPAVSQISFRKRIFNLPRHLHQIFPLYSRALCQRHVASVSEGMERACVDNQGGLSLQCWVRRQQPVDIQVDRQLGQDEVTAKLNPDWPHGWAPTHEITCVLL